MNKYDRFVSLTSEALSKLRMGMVMHLWKGVGLVHARLEVFKPTIAPYNFSIILRVVSFLGMCGGLILSISFAGG